MASGGLKLTVEAKGGEELVSMLNRLGLSLHDMRDAMSDVGDHAKRYFSGQVFASRGGAIGQPWPALSPRYAVRKARTYAGRQPLVRTGLMQRSFTSNPSAMQVVIGNSDPVFKYHQSSAARHKLPRRAMIGIYSGLSRDVRNTVGDSLARKIKEAER